MRRLVRRFLFAGTCLLLAGAHAADVSAPLHDAVIAGDAAKVTALLAKGADVNSRNENGYTPLFLAVDRGRMQIVQLLLDRGADASVRNNDGNTVGVRPSLLRTFASAPRSRSMPSTRFE